MLLHKQHRAISLLNDNKLIAIKIVMTHSETQSTKLMSASQMFFFAIVTHFKVISRHLPLAPILVSVIMVIIIGKTIIDCNIVEQ